MVTDGKQQWTLSGIRLAFSNRSDGDMRKEKPRRYFADKTGFSGIPIDRPEQVHGGNVAFVSGGSSERVSSVDGLITKRKAKSPVLLVLGADCIPILLADVENQTIGAIHAGWKGTVEGVIAAAIEMMVKIGAKREKIQAYFGPSICANCYTIDTVRAQSFLKNPIIEEAVLRKGNQFHVDLALANRLILKSVGVGLNRITVVRNCTSCLSDVYFSYRKRQAFPYGENAGIVCFI